MRLLVVTDPSHVASENRMSTIYQLDGLMTTITQNSPVKGGLGTGRTAGWFSRAGPSATRVDGVSTDSGLQVHVADESLIINPMNDTVNGTQYKYVVQTTDIPSIVAYQTEWVTARLGSQLVYCVVHAVN